MFPAGVALARVSRIASVLFLGMGNVRERVWSRIAGGRVSDRKENAE